MSTRLQVLLAAVLIVLGASAAFAEKTADELFRAGRFEAAATAYHAALVTNPIESNALLRLGEIALLSNRLDEAAQWLKRASEAGADTNRVKTLQAQAYCRKDEFGSAEPLVRELGHKAKADKLKDLSTRAPYAIMGEEQSWSVPFVQTDPLPLISVRINGKEANLIIDTGAEELVLDPEFSQSVGARNFGEDEREGTFGGGKKAKIAHAAIDRIELGGCKVENVPVVLLNTRAFSAAAQGKKVDGVLGTVFLQHFLATLDYPVGRLVLRRKSDAMRREVAELEKSANAAMIPFWMAGDHYIVAWGRLEDSPEALFFVDTGLAGGAFTCPKSALDQAGVVLEGASFQGAGGGGPVSVTPFTAKKLSLGEVRREKLPAFFGPFPEVMEMGAGFRIGGLISHAFFRPFSLTFDFERMRLVLVKP